MLARVAQDFSIPPQLQVGSAYAGVSPEINDLANRAMVCGSIPDFH
jgi:hypothetical protein